MRGKARLEALINQDIGQILMPAPEILPQADSLLLLLHRRKRECVRSGRKGLQKSKALSLFRRHVIDVVQVGIELKLLSGKEEKHGKGQEGHEHQAA